MKKSTKTEAETLKLVKELEEQKKFIELQNEELKFAKKQAHDVALLSDAAIKYITISSDENIYDYICDVLKSFTGAKYIIVNSYNKTTNTLTGESFYAEKTFNEQITKLLGKKVVGFTMNPDEKIIKELLHKKNQQVTGGIFELAGESIPKFISRAIEGLLNIENVYAMGFSVGDELFGSAALLLRKGEKIQNENIIETFINQTSSALQRKAMDEKLNESKEFAELVYKVTPSAIFTVDNNKQITSWNYKAEKITGFSHKEMIGKSCFNFAEEPCQTRCGLFDPQIQKPINAKECSIKHKSGRRIFISKNVDILKDLNGNIIGGIESFEDITEQQKTIKALKESEKRYRLLADHMTDIIWLMDLEFKTIYLSPSSEKLRGYTVEELNDLPLNENLTTSSLKLALEVFIEEKPKVKAASDYNPVNLLELEYYRKDGTTFWLENKFSIIRDENKKPVSILCEGRDITERKYAEENIKKLNEEIEQHAIEYTSSLEQSNKELESFSYSVSHDLRAPLRAIDGFSLALFEDYYEKLDDQAKDYIDRVRTATKRMDTLITSLLGLSRLTRFDLKIETVNLSMIVKEIIENIKDSENIENTRDAEFIIQNNITSLGDVNLLRIVLENLLNNAWKFTSKNDKTIIEFGVIYDKLKTEFYVRDNGVGFDMNNANKIFGAFQRFHYEKDFPGTGIGLATVHRIIRKHNGEIRAESTLNQGATFYFTLNVNLTKF